MAAYVLVLYEHPTDAAAFDQHYHKTHVPLVKQLPGLRDFSVSASPVTSPDKESSIHFIALLRFDSLSAVGVAMSSPEGQAAVNDVPRFASGGASVVMCEMQSQ